MKTRIFLSILGALVLLAAGLGAALTCVEGIKKEEIMSGGRRVSRLVSRDREPQIYWVCVSYNGVVGVALFCAGVALIVRLFRK